MEKGTFTKTGGLVYLILEKLFKGIQNMIGKTILYILLLLGWRTKAFLGALVKWTSTNRSRMGICDVEEVTYRKDTLYSGSNNVDEVAQYEFNEYLLQSSSKKPQ